MNSNTLTQIESTQHLRKWLKSSTAGDEAEYCIGSLAMMRDTDQEAANIVDTVIAAYEIGCVTTVHRRSKVYPQPTTYKAIRQDVAAPRWLVNGAMPVLAFRILLVAKQRPVTLSMHRFLMTHMSLPSRTVTENLKWLEGREFMERVNSTGFELTQKGRDATKV